MLYSMLRVFRYILYILLQCTWGLPQTILGLIFFLIHSKAPHSFFKGCIRTDWNHGGGISLGLFIFVTKESWSPKEREWMAFHEYGHTIQSLLLGPFYLILIGLPSVLWSNLPWCIRRRRKRHISYYSFITERWADSLGRVHRN